VKTPRRIVTGHDETGRAVIALQGEPPVTVTTPALPGVKFYEIWNTRGMPVSIDNGADPTARPMMIKPDPAGSVIRIVDFPPEDAAPIDPAAAAASFADFGSSDAATYKADSPHPLMHRTQTVDYGIVIEGEIHLVLDQGEVKIGPGDVVVQRGTNHAWANRSGKMARMAFVLLDGKFAEELKGS
jgi:mannose-6-phosphate isomerase-like protein (cupin superfamily)